MHSVVAHEYEHFISFTNGHVYLKNTNIDGQIV